MYPEYIIVLLVVLKSDVSCQIDGNFWWLNNDITKLNNGTVPSPTFDDVNELDTDETAKVVFRDDDRKKAKSLNDKYTPNAIHFRDETELAKPSFEFDQLNENNKLWERPVKETNITINDTRPKYDDELRFIFPSDNNLIWTDSKDGVTNKKILGNKNTVGSSNKISHYTTTPKILDQYGESSEDKNTLLPENICTFIKNSECVRNGGSMYEPWLKSNIEMFLINRKVCCILPITTTSIAKIIFPDNDEGNLRHKRSNVEDSPALKQRDTLMSRKYGLDNQKVRATTPSNRKKDNQKIVSSDEYSTDPYWNIKNANIRNENIPHYQDPDAGLDYGSHSYGDDYTVELPRPGLIGLYSDHKQTQTTWAQSNNQGYYYDSPDSVEEEEFETSFGYSTIDPRRDHHLTSKPSRRRPSKLTATSSKVPEPGLLNPTIIFHSNPDFQVLQGFKLLNLMRGKNRFVRKTADNKIKCSNSEIKAQETPSKVPNHLENNHEDEVIETNLKQKLFNGCGKAQKELDDCERGPKQGVVHPGDHPWIALVVLTNSERSILCYATLVHSRVAISIADCVNGKAPGAVSIITGVQDLNEDLAHSQRRMVTVTLDSDYTAGNLDHLALLHWLRPLVFDARVQSACLGDPPTEGNCVFVGWGGYDQEMHSDLRWQRASILATKNCNKRLSKLEVSDALCAAVESRGTVTGVGGPLLCKSNQRWSAVGIAVWRDDVIILLPPREWVMRNMISLRIQ